MIFGIEFLATVRDQSQQISKRLISAPNEKQAIFRLKMDKYRVISIEQRKNPFLSALKQGRLEFGAPAGKRELATFSKNLALMSEIVGKARLS